MRFISYQTSGHGPEFGIVRDDGVIDLGKRMGVPSLKALLAAGRLDEAKKFAGEKVDHKLADITFLSVIPDPAHVWCLAINYQDHIAEIKTIGMMRETPKTPALFMRYADTLTGHLQPILKPKVSDAFDYEGELAVIIGKGGRHIDAADAMNHVGGYSIVNDVSVRDWQRHTTQITPGKNFDASGPVGPWLVTPDEIADPHNLHIQTRLNGVVMQDASTSDMIHRIPAFIAYVSAILPLHPGDILATGTPSGVGFSRKPPIFMKAGDTCEIEIEGIGTLINKVVNE